MDGFLSKDFEGEIKEEQDDGQMWMYSKLIFFSEGRFLFHYLCSEENGQVVLCLKGICYSDSWECAFCDCNKPLGSVHFVTVNLQWQNGVNLTDWKY